MVQANPNYKGVCHVALAQEGHCRPGEVLLSYSSALVEFGSSPREYQSMCMEL
jgi:3-isopropylmalate/(R)-2-methylmalate dehydratase large subunit